jgi:glutamate synthase (ferredoxin)
MEMVAFDQMNEQDHTDLKQLVKNHFKLTTSERAFQLLNDWDQEKNHFVKVMPTDYKKALERLASEKQVKETTR